MTRVKVIGAGLAGSEAAWQLAELGHTVDLVEMKPHKMTPAHHSPGFAELVCSNSLRGAALTTAPGLLKEEMRQLGSLIISCADATSVEAGGALAVDRQAFSDLVTERLGAHPNIRILSEEVTELPESRPLIVATGPLTTDALAESIVHFFGGEAPLSFYDAAAPIVSFESIDMDHAYYASRYGKGTPDYINCPMTREEYIQFVEALREAGEAEVHGFEDQKVFEGCMPVEVMARRGIESLRFGPLKPIGLRDPRTGESPYAVVQLRKDNREGTLYNLVGFQTHLLFGEQKRVFSMIPALSHAEFLRYGVMHRNTFLHSPKLLTRLFEARTDPDLLFVGQMTGVEGYIESAASGLYAGRNLGLRLLGRPPLALDAETAIGALAQYISSENAVDFQPMNINFGIIRPIEGKKLKKREKNQAISLRSLEKIQEAKKGLL